jgi:hypothetical protein
LGFPACAILSHTCRVPIFIIKRKNMDFTLIEIVALVATKVLFWLAMWLLMGGPKPSQIVKAFLPTPEERRLFEQHHTARERIEAVRASLTTKTVRT